MLSTMETYHSGAHSHCDREAGSTPALLHEYRVGEVVAEQQLRAREVRKFNQNPIAFKKPPTIKIMN